MKLSRRLSVIGLPVLLVLAVSGCSTNRATGDQSFTAFMSEEKEIQIGAEEHPKILKQLGGVYDDPGVDSYIRQMGQSLARLSDAPHLPYKFTILNDDRINAFALPGGYVYITRGLLALADTEAEVAGVLAHEIGHVTARHSAERYSSTMATNIGLSVLGVIGSAYGLPSGLGNAVSFGAQAALKGYSRNQELEADMLGVRYLTKAGYNPEAMTSFFRKLDAHHKLEARLRGQGDNGPTHNIMSTHPRTSDRINQAIKLAKQTPVEIPIINRELYLSKIDGMVFGDDPSQGVRRGQDFLHPGLRLAFRVPPGFALFNSPEAVKAYNNKQSSITFTMETTQNARKTGNMATYLSQSWGRKLPLQSVDALNINGMDAATGLAVIDHKGQTQTIRLLAIRGSVEQIFRFVFIATPDEAQRQDVEFRRTTYSVRRLNAQEVAAIRPLRIKVIKPGRRDTLQSLARKTPLKEFGVEWLETLNSHDRNTPLERGRLFKTISD